MKRGCLGAGIRGNTREHKMRHSVICLCTSQKNDWTMKLLLHTEAVSNQVLPKKASQAVTAEQQIPSEIN